MPLILPLRNLSRHLRQTLALGLIIALGIFLLFTGNSIFDGTDRGIEESFTASFTGHLAVRARGDKDFSIFGDETPVIGELFKMPVLPHYREIRETLETLPGVEAVTAVLSGLVFFEVPGYRTPAPLFGVEPSTYFAAFPGIRLSEGRLIDEGEKGVLLPRCRVEEIEKTSKKPLALGADIQFALAEGSTFRIRSAPLRGIFEYPLRNETLDSIVLCDPATFRELYAYEVLSEQGSGTPSTERADAEEAMDLESLFDAPEEDFTAAETGIRREDIEEELAQAARESRPVVSEGLWNFLLLQIDKREKIEEIKTLLELQKDRHAWDVEIADWRKTAGISAVFVYWMRLIFNAGFFVVSFATLVILIDSLVIGVLERVPEIGTMRALGASRSFIRRLFFMETTILTGLAGLVGILLALFVLLYLYRYPVELKNAFLIQLFGGKVLVPRFSWYRVLVSWATALGLGMIGWIYPVRLALKISPKSAMDRTI